MTRKILFKAGSNPILHETEEFSRTQCYYSKNNGEKPWKKLTGKMLKIFIDHNFLRSKSKNLSMVKQDMFGLDNIMTISFVFYYNFITE